jgi:hypothetical protein
MIQPDAHWDYAIGCGGCLYPYNEGGRYFLDGDTIINNKTYHLLYSYRATLTGLPWAGTFELDTTYKQFRYFIREDTAARKVYELNGLQDMLLFDFSLSVGDTLSGHWMGTPVAVTHIDTETLADGSVRTRWNFDVGTSYTEGVGSSEGYWNYPMYGIGWWNARSCYYDGQQQQLGNNNCFTILSQQKLETATPLSMYPNPASTATTLERPEAEVAVFELYNAMGQQVLTKQLYHQQEVVSLEQLPAGIYYYKIGTNYSGCLTNKINGYLLPKPYSTTPHVRIVGSYSPCETI